jgi:hypothetical protein
MLLPLCIAMASRRPQTATARVRWFAREPRPQISQAAVFNEPRHKVLSLRGGSSVDERGPLRPASLLHGTTAEEEERRADIREAEMMSPSSSVLHEIEQESASSVTDAMLDDLVDRAMAVSTSRRVLPSWNGQASWLWRQWQGTIFDTAWRRAVITMSIAGLLVGAHGASLPRDVPWSFWSTPDAAQGIRSWRVHPTPLSPARPLTAGRRPTPPTRSWRGSRSSRACGICSSR